MAQRSIIVGDVHGCFDECLDLLKKCRFQPDNDQIYFVGDLVNKGPKSYEVLQWVFENDYPTVIGNHELRLIEFLASSNQEVPRNWSSLVNRLLPEKEKWLQWLQTLPKAIEKDDFIIVHGGLVPDENWKNSSVEKLAHIRTWDGKGVDLNNPSHPAWHSFYKEEKLVVYGHWAMQGLHKTINSIGLDSGCVYGGQLSALILPENKIVQVDAYETYCKIP